jgi:hypothetical protein
LQINHSNTITINHVSFPSQVLQGLYWRFRFRPLSSFRRRCRFRPLSSFRRCIKQQQNSGRSKCHHPSAAIQQLQLFCHRLIPNIWRSPLHPPIHSIEGLACGQPRRHGQLGRSGGG